MINKSLEEAANQFKLGNINEARKLIIDLIRIEPTNSKAWYALSYCLDDVDKKRECLEKALKYDPSYLAANRALEKIVNQNTQSNKNVAEKQHNQNSRQDDEKANPVIKNEKLRYNVAGFSTIKMQDKRRNKALMIGIPLIIIVAILGLMVFPNFRAFGISSTGALIILFILFFSKDIIEGFTNSTFNKADRAGRGATAEIQIGQMLAGLGEEFAVYNDVTGNYGNIDHVIICRNGGVIMVETKSHRGKIIQHDDKILLNGHETEKDFISQSLSNSIFLQESIENLIGVRPWVTPILVFTNAFVPSMKPIKNVTIINKKFLINKVNQFAQNNKNGNKVWERKNELFTLS